MNRQIYIQVDYRERPSGIPERLMELGAKVSLQTLKRGDYIINNEICIERKSKDDFVLSLIQNRLFKQCSAMHKTEMLPVMLIEGNPYTTLHDIDRQAIKGALVSISISWQMPIIYSANTNDTANLLMMTGKQNLRVKTITYRTGYNPKQQQNKALYFLQGLPHVGAKTAASLLGHFHSITNIMNASEADFQKVEGIGKTKAAGIKKFISSSSKTKD